MKTGFLAQKFSPQKNKLIGPELEWHIKTKYAFSDVSWHVIFKKMEHKKNCINLLYLLLEYTCAHIYEAPRSFFFFRLWSASII